jgi:hypothetical protein
MESIFDTTRALTAHVSKLPVGVALSSFTGDELSELMAGLGNLRQETERVLAWSAAEVNRRSRVEFGGAGMAKAAGYVNSEALIAVLTGTSRAEARKIDRLGRSLMQATDTPIPDGLGDAGAERGVEERHGQEGSGSSSPGRPWFAVVTELMVAGTISPDRCEAIRAGLGNPTETVTNDALAEAATRLLELLHPDDSPETVFRDARQTRALLDRASVTVDETSLQARQEAKVWTSRDGMVHLRADFAPEDGAWIKNTLDLILGPRIGGPRFAAPTTSNEIGSADTETPGDSAGSVTDETHTVDETHTDDATRTAARRITDDPRTTEQIRAATLLSLLKAGTEVDDNAILARKRPTVQIIITTDELTRPDNNGVAFIEGTRYPVTKRTIDRLICDTGYTPLITHPDTGSPLDLGRDVRLFTPTQRSTLATLQGGCVWNNCNKPPAQCEAHHIDPWSQHGKTNIHDGVLLCRYHHQQLHNHNWRITRTKSSKQRYENSYWLTPPPNQDPNQKPIPLRFRATPHPHDHRAQQRA